MCWWGEMAGDQEQLNKVQYNKHYVTMYMLYCTALPQSICVSFEKPFTFSMDMLNTNGFKTMLYN